MNLSDKISKYHETHILLPKDVKEFIKELKEEFKHHLDCMDVDGRKIVYKFTDRDYNEFFEIIDKLAGDKLIGGGA